MADSIDVNQNTTEVDRLDDVALAAAVEQELKAQADWLESVELQFLQRECDRHLRKASTYCFVGHSRAGKDFAATWLDQHAMNVKMGYSLSWYLCRLGSRLLGLEFAKLWPIRHSYYRQLYRLGNAIRLHDTTLLVRMALSESDVIVGPRSRREMAAAQQQKLIGQLIWVERAGLPPDPTLELCKEDCDHVIHNSGNADFVDVLHQFFADKIVFRNPTISVSRNQV